MPKYRKGPEEATRNFARNSLRAFLEGKKTLNWVIGIIRSSGVRGRDLQAIFDRFRGYGDQERLQMAYKRCREEGWL